jgi:hypothetical protein
MADYYTRFSLVLELPDEAAQAYALNIAQEAADMRFGDEAQELRADFPTSLVDVLEVWNFETEVENASGQYGLWLHSCNGGIDAVCAFIQHLLRTYQPGGSVSFEWSNDCSKPRTDAYGGGAAIITARRIKTMNTGEWLQKHMPKSSPTTTTKP